MQRVVGISSKPEKAINDPDGTVPRLHQPSLGGHGADRIAVLVSYRELETHCQAFGRLPLPVVVYTDILMVSTRESRKTAQMCCMCCAGVFWRPGASAFLT